jgi:hypothetical protein
MAETAGGGVDIQHAEGRHDQRVLGPTLTDYAAHSGRKTVLRPELAGVVVGRIAQGHDVDGEGASGGVYLCQLEIDGKSYQEAGGVKRINKPGGIGPQKDVLVALAVELIHTQGTLDPIGCVRRNGQENQLKRRTYKANQFYHQFFIPTIM